MHVATHNYKSKPPTLFLPMPWKLLTTNNFGNCLHSPYSECIKYAARVNLSVVKNQSLKLWFRICS
jgi:hypothetical protein